MPSPNGYVLYSGPSLLDRAPIVCIATGFSRPSANAKTGPMIQTWILSQNQHPIEAIRTGADRSICGTCRLRGAEGQSRACYVSVAQAPSAVWRAFQRGDYPPLAGYALFRHQLVRFGAYGDPAAIPLSVWAAIAKRAAGFTGYTHQWRTADLGYARYLMASADSPAERAAAKRRGYRTFRIRAPGERQRLKGEALCPSSQEAGSKLDCRSCLACCGTSRGLRGDIVISAHGSASILRAYERVFPLNESLAA